VSCDRQQPPLGVGPSALARLPAHLPGQDQVLQRLRDERDVFGEIVDTLRQQFELAEVSRAADQDATSSRPGSQQHQLHRRAAGSSQHEIT
jgi:hypothetical protein